jgi:L-cystine uptake protein TcyP (sodium:dicarboxylate symporter family)
MCPYVSVRQTHCTAYVVQIYVFSFLYHKRHKRNIRFSQKQLHYSVSLLCGSYVFYVVQICSFNFFHHKRHKRNIRFSQNLFLSYVALMCFMWFKKIFISFFYHKIKYRNNHDFDKLNSKSVYVKKSIFVFLTLFFNVNQNQEWHQLNFWCSYCLDEHRLHRHLRSLRFFHLSLPQSDRT